MAHSSNKVLSCTLIKLGLDAARKEGGLPEVVALIVRSRDEAHMRRTHKARAMTTLVVRDLGQRPAVKIN